jgi:hypothetical protein
MRTRARATGAMVCALGAVSAPTSTAQRDLGSPTGEEDPPAAAVPLRPGAWSYFADPRSLRFAGADHAAWATISGQIQVAKLTTHNFKVKTLDAGLSPDDHSSPALARLPNGKLAVFWSPHVPLKHADGMYYRVRNGRTWGPTLRIRTNTHGRNGYAYPNPVRVGRRLMLFWRGGNFQPTYSATRDGRTWSSARTLLTGPQIGTRHPNRRERPYVKYYADNGVVHVAYNEAHPSRRSTSLFYVRLRGSRIADASNVTIGRRPMVWDRGDRVYDGTDGAAWVMDVSATAEGSPVIVYVREHRSDAEYRYVTWDGENWRDRLICASPRLRAKSSYPGGVTIAHVDTRVVYLSRKVGPRFEVEAWATADAGDTWARQALTVNSVVDNIRPTSTLGGKTVLWMTGLYAHYTRFDTSIVMAEARSKAEKRRRERARGS